MNTVPEYLALHRRGYPPDVPRSELRREAQEIRGELSGLEDLQFCADTFKHVRKSGFGLQASSTGIDPNDPTTWKIGEYEKEMKSYLCKSIAALTLTCRMVEATRDARLSIQLTQHSNRVSTNTNLCRGKRDFARQRQRPWALKTFCCTVKPENCSKRVDGRRD